MQIKAAVAIKPNADLEIQIVELDEPKENEVLVKLLQQVFVIQILLVEAVPLPLPVVLGHEGAGVVQKVGANVTDVKTRRPC